MQRGPRVDVRKEGWAYATRCQTAVVSSAKLRAVLYVSRRVESVRAGDAAALAASPVHVVRVPWQERGSLDGSRAGPRPVRARIVRGMAPATFLRGESIRGSDSSRRAPRLSLRPPSWALMLGATASIVLLLRRRSR